MGYERIKKNRRVRRVRRERKKRELIRVGIKLMLPDKINVVNY